MFKIELYKNQCIFFTFVKFWSILFKNELATNLISSFKKHQITIDSASSSTRPQDKLLQGIRDKTEFYFTKVADKSNKLFKNKVRKVILISSNFLIRLSNSCVRIQLNINSIQDGHTYPTIMKLGTITRYLKKIQKIYKSRDTHLESW